MCYSCTSAPITRRTSHQHFRDGLLAQRKPTPKERTKGVNGVVVRSPLQTQIADWEIIGGLPIDPMHCVDIGIVKRLYT